MGVHACVNIILYIIVTITERIMALSKSGLRYIPVFLSRCLLMRGYARSD